MWLATYDVMVLFTLGLFWGVNFSRSLISPHFAMELQAARVYFIHRLTKFNYVVMQELSIVAELKIPPWQQKQFKI